MDSDQLSNLRLDRKILLPGSSPPPPTPGSGWNPNIAGVLDGYSVLSNLDRVTTITAPPGIVPPSAVQVSSAVAQPGGFAYYAEFHVTVGPGSPATLAGTGVGITPMNNSLTGTMIVQTLERPMYWGDGVVFIANVGYPADPWPNGNNVIGIAANLAFGVFNIAFYLNGVFQAAANAFAPAYFGGWRLISGATDIGYPIYLETANFLETPPPGYTAWG